MAKSQEQLQQKRSASSLIYDPQFRSYAFQILLLLGLVVFAWWIFNNTVTNLQAQNKTTGFDFLGTTSGFNIGFTLIEYDRSSTYFDVFVVGILNTLLVAVIGIVLATILGFIVGVARLSNNYIISMLCAVYIEIFRNIPVRPPLARRKVTQLIERLCGSGHRDARRRAAVPRPCARRSHRSPCATPRLLSLYES